MKLKLQSLKPNPFRDLRIDPIDQDTVRMLCKSIHDYGFWSGTVARKNGDGGYEVAAGITRVKAALAAGIEEAEIFVADLDDAEMLRVYATENATQRGNSSTAVMGTIAAAIIQIAKSLIWNEEHLRTNFLTSAKTIETARGNLMNGRGVGYELIERFLEDVPGINEGVIKEQIAALKSSGHYQRLMMEIATEAETIHADEIAEVEKLERQAEVAPTVKAKEELQRKLNKNPLHVARKTAKHVEDAKITFDYDGVAKHLKNAHQVKAFRKSVESAGVAPVLPVENQAPLAKEIARKAADTGEELSGEFIRQNIGVMVGDAKFRSTLATKKQLEESLKTRVQDNFQKSVVMFNHDVRLMIAAKVKLFEIIKNNPEINFRFSAGFKENIERAQQALNELKDIAGL
jgi:ParB-like chromosome segregation protein Spo0J